MRMLGDQIATAGYSIVGVQEGRSKKETTYKCDNWLVFAAPASNGQARVQCWANLGIPFSGKDCFNVSDFIATVVQPRLLIIACRRPGCNVYIIVAHVPTASGPGGLDAVNAFWSEASQALAKRGPDGHPIMLLCDANAAVGSRTSPNIGPANAERENEQGERFHEFRVAHDIAIPSTFKPAPVGYAWTWRSPDGATTHITDFVGISLAWLHCAHSAAVDIGVDLSTQRGITYQSS